MDRVLNIRKPFGPGLTVS